MAFPKLLNFLNSDILSPLKKLILGKHKVSDRPFKIATKYTGVLIAIFMCASMNVKLSCEVQPGDNKVLVESTCYNQDTFLIARCLQPNMGKLRYPGVCGADPLYDEMIRLRYYKEYFIIFFILMTMVFAPHFFWKVAVFRRIAPFLAFNSGNEIADKFLEAKGTNTFLGISYLFYKVTIVALPPLQYVFSCVNLGSRFQLYGYDNIMLYYEDTWPNPRDALFPKMAKCWISEVGFSGDYEIKSLNCELPANLYMQWCFLIYWFWLGLVFIVCSISWLYTFSTWMMACLYKKPIKMDFGDWVLMKFIEMNLNHPQYIDFENHLRPSTNINSTERIIQENI